MANLEKDSLVRSAELDPAAGDERSGHHPDVRRRRAVGGGRPVRAAGGQRKRPRPVQPGVRLADRGAPDRLPNSERTALGRMPPDYFESPPPEDEPRSRNNRPSDHVIA